MPHSLLDGDLEDIGRRLELHATLVRTAGLQKQALSVADLIGGAKDYGQKYLDNIKNMDPATLGLTGAALGGAYGVSNELAKDPKRRHYSNAIAPALLAGSGLGLAGLAGQATFGKGEFAGGPNDGKIAPSGKIPDPEPPVDGVSGATVPATPEAAAPPTAPPQQSMAANAGVKTPEEIKKFYDLQRGSANENTAISLGEGFADAHGGLTAGAGLAALGPTSRGLINTFDHGTRTNRMTQQMGDAASAAMSAQENIHSGSPLSDGQRRAAQIVNADKANIGQVNARSKALANLANNVPGYDQHRPWLGLRRSEYDKAVRNARRFGVDEHGKAFAMRAPASGGVGSARALTGQQVRDLSRINGPPSMLRRAITPTKAGIGGLAARLALPAAGAAFDYFGGTE